MKKYVVGSILGAVLTFGLLTWTGGEQLTGVHHQVVRMEGMIQQLVDEIGGWEALTIEQQTTIDELLGMIGQLPDGDYYNQEEPTGLLGEIARLESELRQANYDAAHLAYTADIWYGSAREAFEDRPTLN